MGFWNQIRNFCMFGKSDEYEEDEPECLETKVNSNEKASEFPVERYNAKLVNINSRPYRVNIFYPKCIDDSAFIGDNIKQNVICIVNLKGVEQAIAQRIIDFLGGAIYHANGSLKKIAFDIVVLAPANVTVSGEVEEELFKNGLNLPWASSN